MIITDDVWSKKRGREAVAKKVVAKTRTISLLSVSVSQLCYIEEMI